MKQKAGRRWLINIIMAAIGIAFLLPLVWLITAALNPDAGPGISAPHASLGNFTSAIRTGAGRDILNSLYLAVLATVVATAVSILAGYTLSRRHVPFKGSILVGVLFLTGLPVSMLLVPIYEMYVKFNWLNSPFWTSFVLAATSVPFAIWLLRALRPLSTISCPCWIGSAPM